MAKKENLIETTLMVPPKYDVTNFRKEMEKELGITEEMMKIAFFWDGWEKFEVLKGRLKSYYSESLVKFGRFKNAKYPKELPQTIKEFYESQVVAKKVAAQIETRNKTFNEGTRAIRDKYSNDEFGVSFQSCDLSDERLVNEKNRGIYLTKYNKNHMAEGVHLYLTHDGSITDLMIGISYYTKGQYPLPELIEKIKVWKEIENELTDLAIKIRAEIIKEFPAFFLNPQKLVLSLLSK